MARRAPTAGSFSENYFALRSCPEYRDWLERFATLDQRSVQSLMECALYRHSAAVGHPAGQPPKRLNCRRGPAPKAHRAAD
jgi:hypothetical protein